jgi:hypothetical protein
MMKDNIILFDPIQVEGQLAVMTDEDTDVKAIQFRGSDETLAGTFHKNHVPVAYYQTPKPRRRGQNAKRDAGDHPHSSTHCGCRTVALPPIGLDLRDLRRLGALYEIQPGLSLYVFPMAGTSTWADITSHRNCMLRRGRDSGSLRTGKPGASVGLYRSKAVAISSRKLSAYFESRRPILGFELKWKGKHHHERRHI